MTENPKDSSGREALDLDELERKTLEDAWWLPVVTDEDWIAQAREANPDETAGKDDEWVREAYANGAKYVALWDHPGDAYDDYEPLADAYLAFRSAAPALFAEVRRLRGLLETIARNPSDHGREVRQARELFGLPEDE